MNFLTGGSEAFIKATPAHLPVSPIFLATAAWLVLCHYISEPWVLWKPLDSFGDAVGIGGTVCAASYYLGFSSALRLVFVGEPGGQPAEARDQNADACGKHDPIFSGLSRTRLYSDLLKGSKVI